MPMLLFLLLCPIHIVRKLKRTQTFFGDCRLLFDISYNLFSLSLPLSLGVNRSLACYLRDLRSSYGHALLVLTKLSITRN